MVAIGQVTTGGGAPHTHSWSEITGEPSTFPPDAHAHSDLSASLAALDGRVDALEAAPDPEVSWAQITGKPATFPPAAHVQAWDTITDKPASFPPATHEHPDLDARLDALEAVEPSVAPVLMKRWNGSAYVDAPDARIFVGDGDPGVMPEGSLWIGPDA